MATITQVSFTADQHLKDRALEKAREEGITLKAFLTFAMKGFVEGKISLGIETQDSEPAVQEVTFSDDALEAKAKKLARLLR